MEAVYVDARGGEPVWVIVKLGRFGKVTAVPFADCAGGPGRLWVAHARKAVRGAPAVSAGQPLTREDELELCDYYRVHPDRGRAAEVTSRPEEAATAEPVAEAG